MLILPAIPGAGTANAGIHQMLGFLLESFAFISLALALGATQHNLVHTALLGFLGIGYCLTGIGQFMGGGQSVVISAGSACLLVSAFCAYYLGMALIVNSSCKRSWVPIIGEP
jgi:succinate-acetate transporter protein